MTGSGILGGGVHNHIYGHLIPMVITEKIIYAEMHLPSLSELISSSVPLVQMGQLQVHGDHC